MLVTLVVVAFACAQVIQAAPRTTYAWARHQAAGPRRTGEAAPGAGPGPTTAEAIVIPATLAALDAEIRVATDLHARARAKAEPGVAFHWVWHAGKALDEAKGLRATAAEEFEAPDIRAGSHTLRGPMRRIAHPVQPRGSVSPLDRGEVGAPPFTSSDRARELAFRRVRRSIRYSLAVLRHAGFETGAWPTGP